MEPASGWPRTAARTSWASRGRTSAKADGEPMCGAHERLYEAVRDRDEDGAEALARAHVADTRASAARLLAAAPGAGRDGLETAPAAAPGCS
ncbi:FCD domain-containing protein [Streptomyces venezuelae ATCC 10712]|nr:FCD domain-containing protein [Streptomyces venezuelae ATCC 10712]